MTATNEVVPEVVEAKASFDDLLIKFTRHTKANMNMALALSHMCFDQFKAHGNLDWSKRFIEAMPQNYLRKVAFARWMVAHSPCKVEKGKLVIDRERRDAMGDAAFDEKGAKAKPFWDFAPEAQLVTWSATDVKEALERALRPFSDGKNREAMDDIALRQLALAQKMVNDLPIITSEAVFAEAA